MNGPVSGGDGNTPAAAQPDEVAEHAQPVSESLPMARAGGDPSGSPSGAGAAPTAPEAGTPAGAEAHPRPHRSGEGKFKGLNELIKVLNGKRGLQLVMLYLVIGRWRIPWGFRVWRGKGQATPAALALKLVRTLPARG